MIFSKIVKYVYKFHVFPQQPQKWNFNANFHKYQQLVIKKSNIQLNYANYQYQFMIWHDMEVQSKTAQQPA